MAEVAIAAVEAVFDWRKLSERELSRNNTEESHEYIETIAFMGKLKHWRKPKYRTADRMHGC